MADVYDIYTDGSCDPNPGLGGWAAVFVPSRLSNPGTKVDEISGSFQLTTISRMELYAAMVALQHLEAPSLVVIHTDSRYLRNIFEKHWVDNWMTNGWMTREYRPVLNKDLIEGILVAKARHRVAFKWGPGHSGHQWNDRADALAVAARVDQISGPQSFDAGYIERLGINERST